MRITDTLLIFTRLPRERLLLVNKIEAILFPQLLGQIRKSRSERMFSGLPPKAVADRQLPPWSRCRAIRRLLM